jgi:hypothetical protein
MISGVKGCVIHNPVCHTRAIFWFWGLLPGATFDIAAPCCGEVSPSACRTDVRHSCDVEVEVLFFDLFVFWVLVARLVAWKIDDGRVGR